MKLMILVCIFFLLSGLSVNMSMLEVSDELDASSIAEVVNEYSQVVEAGRDANISCVTTNYGHSEIITSSIAWKFREKPIDNWSDITDSNESAIFTNFYHSTYESEDRISSILTLRNVTMSRVGEYLCCEGIDGCRTVSKIFLKVGYPPATPIMKNDVDSCITEISDYQISMECCWEIGKSTYADTCYNLTYFTQESEPSNKKCTDEISNKICCNLEVGSRYATVYMYLTALNELGSSTSNQSQVIPSLHVKPPPPNYITLETNDSTNSIKVEWTYPDLAGIHEYDFKIRYAKQEEIADWKEKYATSQEFFKLDELRSQTHYLVSVADKPQSIGGVVGGVWSEWSQSSAAVTGLIAPMKPFLFNDVHTVISQSGQDFFVCVSWFPYDNQKESGFFNQITYEENSNGQKTKRTVKIMNGREYTFRVSYSVTLSVCGAFCNDAGCSREQCRIIDSDKAPAPIGNVNIASINEVDLIATWNPGEEGQFDCMIRICVIKRSLYSPPYSQLDASNECGDQTSVLVVSTNVSCAAGTKTIHGKWSACLEYFAVIHSLSDAFTVLSTPSTLVTYEPLSPPLGLFSIHDVSNLNSFKISVRWSAVKSCFNTNLTILYQPISGAEYQSSSSTPLFQKLVACEQDSTVVSEHIYGYTRYLVKLAFVCDGEPLTELKHGVGEVETRIGEPTAPTDLRVSVRNNPILTWNPPEHKNGNSYYRITRKSSLSKTTDEFRTVEEQIEVLLDCNNRPSETLSFRVYAINQMNSGFLASSNSSSLDDVHCVTAIENENITVDLALGICIPVILMMLMVFLARLFRKRFKSAFFTKIWPDVPKPSIVIKMDCSTCDEDLEFHEEYTRDIVNLIEKNSEKPVKIFSEDANLSSEAIDEDNKFEDEGIADDMSGQSSTCQYGRSPNGSESSESVELECYTNKSEGNSSFEDLGHIWKLSTKMDGGKPCGCLATFFKKKNFSTANRDVKFETKVTTMDNYLANYHVENRSHSFSSRQSRGYYRQYVKFSHELNEDIPFLSRDVNINDNSGTEFLICMRRNDAKSEEALAYNNSPISFQLHSQSDDMHSSFRKSFRFTAVKQALKNYWSLGDLNQNCIRSPEDVNGSESLENIECDDDLSEILPEKSTTTAEDEEDLDTQIREFLDTINVPVEIKQDSFEIASVVDENGEESPSYITIESLTQT